MNRCWMYIAYRRGWFPCCTENHIKSEPKAFLYYLAYPFLQAEVSK